jgi:hypothetical protein
VSIAVESEQKVADRHTAGSQAGPTAWHGFPRAFHGPASVRVHQVVKLAGVQNGQSSADTLTPSRQERRHDAPCAERAADAADETYPAPGGGLLGLFRTELQHALRGGSRARHQREHARRQCERRHSVAPPVTATMPPSGGQQRRVEVTLTKAGRRRRPHVPIMPHATGTLPHPPDGRRATWLASPHPWLA